MPTKKLENKIKTLILKFLNINGANQNDQTILISSFDITEFASLIFPENFIRIAYKKINEKLLTIEEYQLRYFGTTTKVLCGIILDNELIYQNFQYMDCRENYYKNTINNNKNICNNGVELDLNGQDCEYVDDGTNWEKLAGINTIQKSDENIINFNNLNAQEGNKTKKIKRSAPNNVDDNPLIADEDDNDPVILV